MEMFVKENNDPMDCTRAWSNNEEKIKKDKNGMYSTTSICPPYSFVAAMLCWLFGRPNNTKFSPDWFPLIEAIINPTVIYWAQILSDNLSKTTIEYRSRRSIASRVYRPFFMSAYVMEAICFSLKFPIMGWKWTIQNPLPIHIYDKVMWESNFQPHFFNIFHGIMQPIYKLLYNRDAPIFTQEAEVDILLVAKWFGEEKFIYIRFFGSITSPHILPYYVPDKLMAREITYSGRNEPYIERVKEGNLAYIPCIVWSIFTARPGTHAQISREHSISTITQIPWTTI